LTSDKLGVAVVGAGYWGRKLIGEYLSLSGKRNDLELRCVADCDRNRLASIANEFHLRDNMVHAEPSEVLQDSSVQAVHVAAPNETHFKLGMQVLDARRHLLLEKPMAMTTREALKLARRAEEHSLVLQVGHIFRFNNAVKKAKSLLANDAVGKPLYLSMEWNALFAAPAGRDIVFDLAPHPVDITNYLLDEWPTRVIAIGRSFVHEKTAGERMAFVVTEFNHDILAQLSLSWIHHGPKTRRVIVTGESGTVEIDALDQRVTLYRGTTRENCRVQPNNTIESEIGHFVDAIVRKGASENSALIGAMNVAVLSAAKQSMKTGSYFDVLGREDTAKDQA